MKRLLGVVRWLLIAFGLGVVALFAAHLVLRPNPKLAASEQYHVLSAYIEPNLTGESHDLGSSNGLVVIDGRTTFSAPFVNSSKFKQYASFLASTGRAKAKIPQLRHSLVFEFWAANLRDLTLERRFQLPARYEIATEQEMKLYPSEAFFARFVWIVRARKIRLHAKNGRRMGCGRHCFDAGFVTRQSTVEISPIYTS